MVGDPHFCFGCSFEARLCARIIVLGELDLKTFAGLDRTVGCLCHASPNGVAGPRLHGQRESSELQLMSCMSTRPPRDPGAVQWTRECIATADEEGGQEAGTNHSRTPPPM